MTRAEATAHRSARTPADLFGPARHAATGAGPARTPTRAPQASHRLTRVPETATRRSERRGTYAIGARRHAATWPTCTTRATAAQAPATRPTTT